MAEHRPGKAGKITNLVVLALLVATAVASLCLWHLGDWKNHAWTLTLTLRILWGIWIVVCLTTILTRVTIFGWTFRQYFRWPEEGRPSWARFRPSRAPWSKSGKASFSMTVAMVSVTGAVAVAVVVMWVLKDITGDGIFWTVFKILGASYWVVMIVLVLVRVAIFGAQRHQALQQRQQAEKSLAGQGNDSSESRT